MLGMAIEGMIEFVINGYLNAMTAELNLLGEIIGIFLSGFCLFTNSIFLPISILFIALNKNEYQIRSENM